ncbi:MAG: 50S ribosomal protein L3 N(5)-glutamine methyltransferase [Gammaproteobacteria bacterium]
MPINISKDLKRNSEYNQILNKALKNKLNLIDLSKFGAKMMKKYNCHPHFFRDHSLLTQASYLVDFFNQTKTVEQQKIIETLKAFEKRIENRIPVEYITEEAWYLGRSFYVDSRVLIPRSLMSSRFGDFLKAIHWENYKILDLCSGSGCIGISLALMNPKITVDLSDISPEALEVSKINIKKYNLENRVNCIQSDLFDQIKGQYDLIISNPPYVPEGEYYRCPEELKMEPKLALTAGEEGMSIINRILNGYKNQLNPNGTLILEVGYTAAKHMKKKYKNMKFQWLNCQKENPDFLDRLIEKLGLFHSICICR